MLHSQILGPKHIFRAIIFHHHLEETVPLELICKVIPKLYYPNEPTGELAKKYKLLLLVHLKEFTNQQRFITQQQFCQFYETIQKYDSLQYKQHICKHIFNRYKNIQQKGQEIIDLQGFLRISEGFQIDKDQAKKCFYHVANRKNVITFDKFLQYMTLSKEEKPKVNVCQ